jgi:Flp pilus assembly pilin Flp
MKTPIVPGGRLLRRTTLLRRWCSDENGQDLIEYMLLGSVIAIAGWLGMQAIGTNMNTTYRSWDTATQDIWEVPDPVATP